MTKKHIIVQLDGSVEIPSPDFPHEFTRYKSTKPHEVAERIRDATIVIATITRLTYDALINEGPNLQLVSPLGVGYDNINLQAIKERGLTLLHVPAQNTDSVTEHAFALYSAVKRNILPLHNYTLQGVKWPANGVTITEFRRPPKTNKEEILGVIGYGALGKSAERMGKALGMTVLVAERKGHPSTPREGRLPFDQVIAQSTLLIMTCPLDPSTHNMVDTPELHSMRDDAIIVNVGRGGIINELALATALKEYRIAGAATDVFETEPASRENCPLLDSSIPNLVLTPHIAWFSSATLEGTQEVTKRNLECFVEGRPQNVVWSKGK